MPELVYSPGEQGILNRLRDSAEKIASLECHLAAERGRRDLLLLKGTTAGLSTRLLGARGGMSSPGVTYATRRARAALAALPEPQDEDPEVTMQAIRDALAAKAAAALPVPETPK